VVGCSVVGFSVVGCWVAGCGEVGFSVVRCWVVGFWVVGCCVVGCRVVSLWVVNFGVVGFWVVGVLVEGTVGGAFVILGRETGLYWQIYGRSPNWNISNLCELHGLSCHLPPGAIETQSSFGKDISPAGFQ